MVERIVDKIETCNRCHRPLTTTLIHINSPTSGDEYFCDWICLTGYLHDQIPEAFEWTTTE